MGMAPVTITMPNLISGVSQQPPSLRLSTSMEKMDNCWPSVVSGLNKRPPTEHVANLNFSVSTNAIGHLIDRNDSYRYIVTITDNEIIVVDASGKREEVLYPDGKQYIAQALNPVEDIKFLTIADTTFVLNKRVTVLGRDIDEGGSTDLVPDTIVETEGDLPDTEIIGKVYQVSSNGKYYRYEAVEPVTATYKWEPYGEWSFNPPNNGPQYTGLPALVPELGYVISVYGDSFAPPGEPYQIVLPTGQLVQRKYHGFIVAIDQPYQAGFIDWIERTPAELATVEGDRLSPATTATVHVTQSIANSFYTVYFDGIKVAEHLTKNGTSAAESVEPTSLIASNLAEQMLNQGYTVRQRGSTVIIFNLNSATTISTLANNGDKALKCYRGTVSSFSDLPPNEIEGRVVKVKGETKTNGDDYYVRYREGIWEETVAYGHQRGLDSNSMPWVLQRQFNGKWVFKRHKWGDRSSGDENSNPDPSFIGQTLNDIFLYTNRLGFLSVDNVILSESNQFENFFRTTLTQVIDSDPLDFAVTTKATDSLNHATAFNKDLLLMGSQSQHRFSYQQFVGPKNVSTQFTTSFNCSPNVSPINMGSSVYFIDDRLGYNYAKVWEYFPKPDQQGDDADEVSAPIPRYIPTGVKFIAASPRVKCAFIFSDSTPNTLYLYKFFWANSGGGDRKVQNAWSTWTFPGVSRIYWAGFMNNYLYMVVQRSDGVQLERIRIDEEVFDKRVGNRVLLDRAIRMIITRAEYDLVYKAQIVTYDGEQVVVTLDSIRYDSAANATFIRLPYKIGPEGVQVCAAPRTNERLDVTYLRPHEQIDDYTVRLSGDYLAQEIIIGIPYNKSFTFSTPFIRQQKGTGEVVLLTPRLQMRHLDLEYHDTAYFTSTTSLPGRPDSTKTFDAKLSGISVPLNGNFKAPLLGRNLDVTLRIDNPSPFNSSFGSAEWYAIYAPKTQRV